jgi:hypothetical protein
MNALRLPVLCSCLVLVGCQVPATPGLPGGNEVNKPTVPGVPAPGAGPVASPRLTLDPPEGADAAYVAAIPPSSSGEPRAPWGNFDHPVVQFINGEFAPYYVHVHLGSPVTWVNRSASPVAVTYPPPGGGDGLGTWEIVIPPGGQAQHVYTGQTGSFTYASRTTPDAHGNVVVVGAGR